jgi:hypothetical protein
VASLNHDTNSDSGSTTASGSEEETEYEMPSGARKGEADCALALFSSVVSAWNDGQAGKPSPEKVQRGGKEQQRVHRTAEERKQVSSHPAPRFPLR